MREINTFIALMLFGLLFSTAVLAKNGKPVQLKCEYLTDPIGIDISNPRLTWKMEDSRQGAFQTAYQVIVDTDSMSVVDNLGTVWDTGKQAESDMLVSYAGERLRPLTRYFWKVIVWDRDGKAKPSEVAVFEMGMMGVAHWKGAWISDHHDIHQREAPYFRKEFMVKKTVKYARIYIATAGLHDVSLNGERVGDHRLDPMYTRYDRRILYVTYDITKELQSGANAVGVILGNGWYNHQAKAVWNFDQAPWRNRPAFCMDLHITYDDGSSEVIVSERDWKTSLGEIISNNIYTAEHYDARLEQVGWNTVGFDDRKWQQVMYRSAPAPLVTAQALHPIRNVNAISPQSVSKLNDSTYLYDLGRNIAGVTQFSAEGEAGTVIKLIHGERLRENGHVDMSNIDVYYRPTDDTDPFQTDIVILSGKGVDTFMPKFNYKGFRYIEVVSSTPIDLTKDNLLGYFMHSDVPPIGNITSSDSLINRIAWANNNSYLSNLFGYPTDCPQREKNGWTGDGHFAIETALYNFDGITVYEKWLADHRDEQQPNGVLPDIIPTGGWGYGTANGTDWTSTIAIIPWNLYLFYGDLRPLKDNYDAIKRYVDYVTWISPAGLTSWGRGDWVPVKTTSSLELTSSIYYYTDAVILAKAAKLLRRDDDHLKYTALARKVRDAINSKYFDEERALYASGTQTELSMALMWGVVPDDKVKAVAKSLSERVRADGNQIDVGVLGAKAILNALSENGYPDLAYQLASRDTYPSWGAWIAAGATTFLENWDLHATRDISDNHMMFGEIGAWFFKALGGIKPDENAPGFKNILLQPHFVKGLDTFSVRFDGPYGEIKSSWRRSGEKIFLDIVIPANSGATLILPDGSERNLQAGTHAIIW
ncbi:alpha-L-rhamnosidase [Sphingobacterium corticibacterium]|uniref:alpha-L-rhamnosidase n=1 Tax=Sphingobacterium corticibacterium TaxID=2484746 RepID=A0A4Q6XHU1_9SPHI|nr:alpha-L-rhamnosidase [Sphingobacterium corticibacterium]RZF59491.1 alpha-rhamnosidase [Sphingobacterium corticibacterium]